MPDPTLHAALSQVHSCAQAAHETNEECEALRHVLARQRLAAQRATAITAQLQAELTDQASALEQRVAFLRPLVARAHVESAVLRVRADGFPPPEQQLSGDGMAAMMPPLALPVGSTLAGAIAGGAELLAVRSSTAPARPSVSFSDGGRAPSTEAEETVRAWARGKRGSSLTPPPTPTPAGSREADTEEAAAKAGAPAMAAAEPSAASASLVACGAGDTAAAPPSADDGGGAPGGAL
eukprot:6331096-Prymnesium_polylepis.1